MWLTMCIDCPLRILHTNNLAMTNEFLIVPTYVRYESLFYCLSRWRAFFVLVQIEFYFEFLVNPVLSSLLSIVGVSSPRIKDDSSTIMHLVGCRPFSIAVIWCLRSCAGRFSLIGG